ncbi:MAG: acyl-CoA dehydrogenase family protein [Acidimicrobiales bacterium]
MAMTPSATTEQIEAWVEENWDPEITVAQWWQRLADDGLSQPMLPEPWGRAWSRDQASALAAALAKKGAVGQPNGIGMMLAVPTILAHGSDELIAEFVPKVLNGQHGWCQLFSEPGAGSDLAGLQTKAERDGEEWIINGQKVWTSTGQYADYGILVARSNPDLPKHKGLTYFAFPMLQPGVEVRPLREMTGRAMFNEVFIDNGRVPDSNMIGGITDGWKVTNTTLMVERAGIGGGSVAAFSAAIPGTVAGHLDRRVGDFAGDRSEGAGLGAGAVGRGRVRQLIELARRQGVLGDPTIRQDLARLHSVIEISGYHIGRMKSGNAATGGEGNMAKLRNSAMLVLTREVGCRILGAHATVTGSDSMSNGDIQELTLFSPAPSIYGGTDQVQRNIIGERVLGLPKEPGPGKDTPFKELLHNPTR